MKYLKNPPIQQSTRESYANEIISHFNGYIKHLKRNYADLNMTFIPSSSKIPDDIADKLSTINSIPLKTIISKNTQVPSKNITDLSSQQFNKYTIDLNQSSVDNTFILIDDVMGTAASICETMHKLYDFNKNVNFFFVPVKDVKR